MFARLAAFLAILALTLATAAASAHAMRMTFAGVDMPAMAHAQHMRTVQADAAPAVPGGMAPLAAHPPHGVSSDAASPEGLAAADDCCDGTRTAGGAGDICALSCAVLAGALPPEGTGPGMAHRAEGHALPRAAAVDGRNPELADRPPRTLLL